MIDVIFKLLSPVRFPLDNEKSTQAAIEGKLKEAGINFSREHYLDNHNIPDFFIPVDGIAIEVKIKGNAKAIYKQCERYCEFDETKQLILITNKTMGFPKEILGKPCYLLNIGKAWM